MNNPTDIKLYELLGSKELTFGLVVSDIYGNIRRCSFTRVLDTPDKDETILGHPPTIADLHKWLNEKSHNNWSHSKGKLYVGYIDDYDFNIDKTKLSIPYNSSLPLLEQEETTKLQIIELITNHS